MPHEPAHALWLIPALPAAGAAFIFLFATAIGRRAAGRIACAAVGLSFACVVVSALQLEVSGQPRFVERLWMWLDAGSIRADAGFLLDRLSYVFALVVTGVGLLIHLYSYAYMEEDEGARRFFGYLNLFVASMLVLVMADNGFFMFLGWEGVGACSFFLIGHWYAKPANVAAAQKAFLVTRIGDIFLLLGLLLAVSVAGVDFTQLGGFEQAATRSFGGASGTLVLSVIAILLLIGAAGKSAQLPLQVWLPDAMAGPTPVSALIHAATMVTAGVYLICRFHPLFALCPDVMRIVALVGVGTAFYGATCAVVQTDLKRALAYSTISQIGYMILGCGVGAFSLAVFHFFTHAFYKALLFMSAGTVIHSLGGEQNIHRMGGLRGPLRRVYFAFAAGVASLAGIPLVTAGFYSKDAILWSTLNSPYGGWAVYGLALFTAFLTAFYAYRLLFMVFHGRPAHEHHIHAPAPLLVWPLQVLAAFAIFAGFLNVPILMPAWERFFHGFFGKHQLAVSGSHAMEIGAAALSGVLALGGAWIAARLHAPGAPPVIATRTPPEEISLESRWPYRSTLANLLFHGWEFDRAYGFAGVGGFRRFCAIVWSLDRHVVDNFFTMLGVIAGGFHNIFRFFQNGRLSRYALVMLIGAMIIVTVLVECVGGGR